MAKNIKCSLNIYISLFDASRCQTHIYPNIFILYQQKAAKPMQPMAQNWRRKLQIAKVATRMCLYL